MTAEEFYLKKTDNGNQVANIYDMMTLFAKEKVEEFRHKLLELEFEVESGYEFNRTYNVVDIKDINKTNIEF